MPLNCFIRRHGGGRVTIGYAAAHSDSNAHASSDARRRKRSDGCDDGRRARLARENRIDVSRSSLQLGRPPEREVLCRIAKPAPGQVR